MRKYPCHEKKIHCQHDWQSYAENTGGHSNTANVSRILNGRDSDDDAPLMDENSVAS